MSDSDTTAPPPPEQAEAPQSQQHEQKKPARSAISLSIWPPTQRTRDAVVTRLIETLSTPSVLSKRYGTIPQEEAAATARRIEEEACEVANAATSTEEDGLDILQLYSKEISKRMLDTVKTRTGSDSAANYGILEETPKPAAEQPASTEEVASSVETEA